MKVLTVVQGSLYQVLFVRPERVQNSKEKKNDFQLGCSSWQMRHLGSPEDLVGASKTAVVEQCRWQRGAKPRPLGGQDKVGDAVEGVCGREVREEARKGTRDSMVAWCKS